MTASSDRTRRPILAALLTALLGTLLAGAAGAQSDAYRRGQDAIAAEQWERAVEAFERAQRENPAEDAAALYWQAYALMQEGRTRAAERRIRDLERRHADSRWIDDARALSAGQGTGTVDEAGLDEELRLYALSQLLERDPDRALPLLMGLVERTDSDRTRRDAMFLLGMSDAREAQQAVARIARDSDDPALRVEAIHALGVSGGDAAEELLRELAGNTADPTVLLAIVQAAIPMDADGLLVDIVRRTDDPQVQHAAIHSLGALEETEVLRELYPSINDPASRMAVLHAMAMAEDLEGLDRVLASETQPELRTTAIRSLGMIGDSDAAARLKAIFADPSSREDQLAVLESLVMLDENDGRELAVSVARTADEPEIVMRAIQTLAMLEATDELRDLYEHTDDRASRITIIQSLGIADDADGLTRILQVEQDAELRAHAIRSMAHLDQRDEDLGETLVALYGEADPSERQAILDALMIRSDARTIIQLLEQEPDRERKRRLLQILSMIDDEEATDYLFELIEHQER